MAEHAHHGHQEKVTTAEGNDYAQHVGTYRDFVTILKWSILAVAMVLVFLWVFVY